MQDSFIKFKKKIFLETLIKCFVFGLSFGLIVFAVPLIIFKIQKVEYNLIYLILIALASFIFVFGLLFLILKPSKVKIAKRIDKDLNLNEKVHTMIEYEQEDNLMVQLQRENTLNILANTSTKKLSMKFGIVFFICLTIGIAACISAVAIPKYEEGQTEETPDVTYEVDDWTILAIRNIIEKVNNSTADETLKTKYVDLLEKLILELENNIDKENQMKQYVLNLINDILLELDKKNTNNEVFTVLKDSSNSLVSSLAVEINLLDSKDIRKQIENIAALINGSADAITEFNEDFGRLLKSSNLDKKDSLYISLEKLADEIYEVRNELDVLAKVQEVIDRNIEDIISIIDLQAENYRIAHYIEYELKNIFNLNETVNDKTEEDEEQNGNPYDDEENDDHKQQDNSGGLGTGDVLFGSDDEFFDPEKGTVVYGDVITTYYGNILGKLNEGMLDEKLREYFEYYYSVLLGDGNFDEE